MVMGGGRMKRLEIVSVWLVGVDGREEEGCPV